LVGCVPNIWAIFSLSRSAVGYSSAGDAVTRTQRIKCGEDGGGEDGGEDGGDEPEAEAGGAPSSRGGLGALGQGAGGARLSKLTYAITRWGRLQE
jgi:hypothetical protein